MLPNPMHPAVVHFPVVLAFLLPLFVAGALLAIRRGANARRAWANTAPRVGGVGGCGASSRRTGRVENGMERLPWRAAPGCSYRSVTYPGRRRW